MNTKRLLTAILLAIATQLASMLTPAVAAASAEEELIIEGGGWGHGIGMSQYGAFGQALEGQTAEEIVGYYYSGSSTAQIVDQVGADSWLLTDPSPLWVNLLADRTVFRFSAVGGPLTVCQTGAGGCILTANPGESWRFVALGNGTCRWTADGAEVTEPATCRATVKRLRPNAGHIVIAGLDPGRDEFARGTIQVRTPNDGASFHVVLRIKLEDYLYGLAEVPFSWHEEALRAQALAGRSFATWKLLNNGPEPAMSQARRQQCWCQLYATVVDQSYSGWANEAANGADRWRGAVDSTAQTVITHPAASQANIVAAFYSSSTGGRTENKEDVWGGSPVPYLQSQADPWSQDPAVRNPFAKWAFPFTESELAATYGLDKVDGVEIHERFDSGTPQLMHVHGRLAGEQVTITTSGPSMYSELSLRGRHIRAIDYGPIPAVAGDFTGDGRGDVAMVTAFNRAWWIGASTPGRFAMAPWNNHRANNALHHVVSGDFNGDGKQDVAALQAGTGKLLVGLSNGRRFDMQVWANHPQPERWGPLLVGDFDGDGRDDLAEYENVGERWRVYRLGSGALTREFWYDFGVANPNWAAFAPGDYNGDQRDDILAVDGNTGDLIVLFSDGSGFAPSTWQTLPSDGPWQSVQAADFTGDGRDDLAAYDPSAARWWIVAGTNRASGLAPAVWFTYVNPEQEFAAQVSGDFNADGKADIAAYNSGNGKIKVLVSSGSGFTNSVWGRIPPTAQVTTVRALDATGDGTADLAAWDDTKRRWWLAAAAGADFDVTAWGTLLR